MWVKSLSLIIPVILLSEGNFYSKVFSLKDFFNCKTYSLAPGQSSGVMFFDVVLHLSPDVDVGLHPVHMCLVPVRTRKKQICLLIIFSHLNLGFYVPPMYQFILPCHSSVSHGKTDNTCDLCTHENGFTTKI